MMHPSLIWKAVVEKGGLSLTFTDLQEFNSMRSQLHTWRKKHGVSEMQKYICIKQNLGNKYRLIIKPKTCNITTFDDEPVQPTVEDLDLTQLVI